MKYDIQKAKLLARTSKEVKKFNVWRRVLRALLMVLAIVVTMVYIISVLYTKFGSFTVSVNKFDANKYSLTLCETPDFNNKKARLNAKAAEDVTNISGNDLPADLDNINGQHNGENYIAYTYYLTNVGQDTVTYEYNMFIANVSNAADTAVRIRLYKDGEPVTYARTRTDGTGPEYGTVEFLTNRTVVRNSVRNFKPGDKAKFTVVIWIEGDDPDCVDSIIGGTLKTDMIISVVESGDGEKKNI